ncbi:hypothetical protein [uncultured Mitsuokella sp.]|uniref:hypothetical protein n=1 Tax=uncultured Mitsuokella sp. TaxID=453120 RepID=UPI0025847243|nr:hypothetical protein [uncultured Mitsuokella sp.]
MEVKQEYERLRELFQDGADEKLMEAADGAIMEAARIRCQLDELNKIARAGGLVKYDPANPSRQKTQPVARTITQVRASYISYVAKLTKMLGGGSLEDDDDDLDEYE